MTRRKSTASKARAKRLPPAGARSGLGAASVMPYLQDQLAGKPKAAQPGDPPGRKQRRRQ